MPSWQSVKSCLKVRIPNILVWNSTCGSSQLFCYGFDILVVVGAAPLVDLRIFFGQEFVSRYDSRQFIGSIACKNNERRRRRWTWHQNVRCDASHVEIFEHITLLRYKRKTKATTSNNRTMGKTDITVTKRNGKYATSSTQKAPAHSGTVIKRIVT